MCEFCSNPFAQKNLDALDSTFAGFFSPEAIEAAIRQAKKHNVDQHEEDRGLDGYDTDGT